MNTTCKNCNTSFTGNYCPECGQTADTHKLNHHFVWHDIQHGLFHYDKGIVHAAKELYTRPGHFIREYIEGKRVKHFKPISLLLILASISGFLAYKYQIKLLNLDTSTDISNGLLTIEELNHWVTTHYAWIILFTVPIRAFTTYIIFRKQGYNYYEHIVLAAYLASQRLLLSIAVFPIDYWLKDTALLPIFLQYNSLIEICLSIWGHTQFFNRLPKGKVIALSILSWVFFLAIMTLCLLLILNILNYKI
ncbi:DUF3667 domain-containing protein [Flavobacterium sp. RSB2_4_14]|uniref:DUF3667 domain-containing protein n=1 Tax=Flavobacterium sp. RSB2_4_14 TaxID=3447665 RepID=UPI003F2C35BE